MINKSKTSHKRAKASKREATASQPTSASNPPPRLVYSMSQAAELLGVSYITVHRLLKRGKLRASDAIRNKMIPHAEIERFLRDSLPPIETR